MPEQNQPPAKNDRNDAATATSDALARPASPRRAVDKIPRQFGRYRIEETLGKGGMGAVFRAFDTQLDRPVALKVPFLGDDEAETRQRFFREARAAATLQHAYICPVFDVGEFNDIPYLTMAFIEGRSLNQALTAGQTFTFSQIAVLVRKLCLGMQEAHNRGVVHRDLKPANILQRPNGEPVIMDFGLARRADDKRSHGLTQEGDILGTLDYMAPEQAEGNQANIGPSVDIYALGAILYELLCGERPFKGNTASMLVQIMTKEPARPSEVRPGVPAKLEEICLKAMAKKQEDRFPSMTAFAIALAEYLRGLQSGSASGSTQVTRPAAPAVPAAETPRPAATQVTRRPELDDEERPSKPRSSRTSRSGRKGPRSGKKRRGQKNSNTTLILGIAVAVMAFVVVAIVVAAALWPKKDDQNKIVPVSTSPAGPPPGMRPPQQGGAPPGAAPATRPAGAQQPKSPSRGGVNIPNLIGGSNDGVLALKPQPDDLTLGVGESQQVMLKFERGNYGGPATINFTAPRELRVTPASPIRLQGNQSDATLTVRMLALPAADVKLDFKLSYDVEPARGTVTSTVAVHANANSPCVRLLEMPVKANMVVESLAFGPDASVALIGGGSTGGRAPGPGGPPGGGGPPGNDGDANAIQILNVNNGEILGTLPGHKGMVNGIVIAADGKLALSYGADDHMIVWDLSLAKAKLPPAKQPTKILAATLSPDAKRGLLLLAGGLLKFNPNTMQQIGMTWPTAQLSRNQLPDSLRTVAMSNDNRGLVGGLDGKLIVIDPPEKGKVPPPKSLTDHTELIACAAFDRAGKVAAVAGGGVFQAGKLQPGRDYGIRLWDAAEHTVLWTGKGHTDTVICLAFSADGTLLASGSADGNVRVWNAANGRELASFTGHSGRVLSVGFAADNKTVWSGAADKTLRQWRLP